MWMEADHDVVSIHLMLRSCMKLTEMHHRKLFKENSW